MTSARTNPVLDPGAMRRHAGDAAKLIRALSNQHRLLVLCVLSEGELSVGELNSRVRLSQSALSQHLGVLRHERVVSTRRSGQTIFYSVAGGIALELIQVLHDHYCGVPARAPSRPVAERSRGARKPARALA